ncbi:hypothetical protein B0J13DRAFT_457112, partial [Dactylonectria estremocensis]
PRTSSPSLTRAQCDGCRARKIRCDRTSPCFHCIQARIPCTHANARPKNARTRINLTSEYERKIDLLDKRLEEVTQLLQSRQINSTSPGTQSTSAYESPARVISNQMPAEPSNSFENTAQSASDSPVVEGESSLAAQSVFAHDFIQNAVHTHSTQDSSLELRETLDCLHRITNGMKQQRVAVEMAYPNAKPTMCSAPQDYALPPIQKTVALIQAIKNGKSETISWILEFCSIEHFSDLCLRVYFSKDFSESDFIIANAGLLYLFQDYANRIPDERNEALSFVQMCHTNLETALAILPLHLPTNIRTILALVLGAVHAVEISKPSLAWTLVSKASELCQTLGFHRLGKNDDNTSDVHQRQTLFWCVYFLDKSLSLRLGRASTIPDWDVTLPIPPTDLEDSTHLLALACQWIKTARCQGRIYEMLYSPESMPQPDHVRNSRVHELANELNEIMTKSAEINTRWIGEASKKIGHTFANFITVSDDILCLSLLTLVYRASPSPPESSTPFISECIDAARRCLRRHQDCMAIIENVHSANFTIYMHWTLLFAPFIPFIVLFCHVIETQDQMDLDRLGSFISSMESTPAISDQATRVIHLFRVLFSAARRYVEFRNSSPSADQGQARERLHTYMFELGLPVHPDNGEFQPHGTRQAQGEVAEQGTGDAHMSESIDGQRATDYRIWMSNTTHLEEWFDSNHQMLEMINEPNFTFHPSQQE